MISDPRTTRPPFVQVDQEAVSRCFPHMRPIEIRVYLAVLALCSWREIAVTAEDLAPIARAGGRIINLALKRLVAVELLQVTGQQGQNRARFFAVGHDYDRTEALLLKGERRRVETRPFSWDRARPAGSAPISPAGSAPIPPGPPHLFRSDPGQIQPEQISPPARTPAPPDPHAGAGSGARGRGRGRASEGISLDPQTVEAARKLFEFRSVAATCRYLAQIEPLAESDTELRAYLHHAAGVEYVGAVGSKLAIACTPDAFELWARKFRTAQKVRQFTASPEPSTLNVLSGKESKRRAASLLAALSSSTPGAPIARRSSAAGPIPGDPGGAATPVAVAPPPPSDSKEGPPP